MVPVANAEICGKRMAVNAALQIIKPWGRVIRWQRYRSKLIAH